MIELSQSELSLVKRAMELFMEVTKKDCEELPVAIEIHRKFSDLSGPQTIVVDEEQISNWTYLK